MMDTDSLLKKKILDAANKAYNQNIYTYTNFLSMPELSIYSGMKKELSFIHSETFGGSDACERQMVQFGSEDDLGYPGNFPIVLIKISPLIEKFSDNLSHRDFLGAILNLGIDRSLIGDIIVKENTGFVFCVSHISDYIINNLSTIRHTHIKCELSDVTLNDIAPHLKSIELICASSRIDAIVSSITRLSRSKCLELFRTQRIFLNGKTAENNSCLLKNDDILVIRGTGKFIYRGEGRKTQKGRIYIKLDKYE